MLLIDQLKEKKKHGLVKRAETKASTGHDQPSSWCGLDINHVQQVQLDLNLEQWYVSLGPEITFPSSWVEIPVECAREMLTYREGRCSLQRVEAAWRGVLDKLQSLIEEYAGDSGYVFVKTSCRSAKDQSVNLRDEFESLSGRLSPETFQERLRLLMIAATRSMQMRSAKQVFDAFASSFRTECDFRMALEQLDQGRPWAMNIIVRRWVPMAVDAEFRCFVHKNHLTAISQYNVHLLSDRLIARKTRLRSVIENFWKTHVKEQVRSLYPEGCYIVDLGLSGSAWEEEIDTSLSECPAAGTDKTFATERCWVIELNPFLPTTGACLFDWDADQSILLFHGDQKDVSFRITESWNEKQVLATLSPDWINLLKKKAV